MTAVAEARALLDQLMGGDRNAALPEGAALPRKNGSAGGGGEMLLLPGKRSKSCYDRDIDPLYCAWGIDVYELFVNTKSDIGPNPYKADDAARKEYLALPAHEQERLGFEHLLFNKLGELVQSCDRTVHRNQEKLNKELHRQLQKRGGQDYVIDVDEVAVEQLCRNQIRLGDLQNELKGALEKLSDIKQKEDEALAKAAEESRQHEKESKKGEDADDDADADEPAQKKVKTEDATVHEKPKEEDSKPDDEVPLKEEDTSIMEVEEAKEETVGESAEAPKLAANKPPSKHALELGAILLEKQVVVVDIANLVSQVSPLQESVEKQEHQLKHVKSDITTDKTVCDVSGNFMSARDADERIAAHYAGKQYVGWKLVRDKLSQLLKQHGKYGPPPPGRGPPPPGVGGPQGAPMHLPSRGGGGGGDRGGYRGGGGNDMGRGGGGGRRDSGGRWERGGGGGGYDRGGGGYDRGGGGGGGYSRGGDRGGDRGGGGGNYNRGGGRGWR